MRTPLAWLNLAHNRVRTLVAVAGVTFAVILIFMQLGFLGSLKTSAVVIYDALEFDLCIRSRDYLQLSEPRSFPETRLLQAEAVPGVARALPFRVTITRWRIPETAAQHAGETRGIMAMGVRPGDPVFRSDEIQSNVDRLLRVPEFCLIDRETRSDYGPINGERFGDDDIGRRVETEVGDRRVRLVGHFTLGAGFAADGSVMLNDRGFTRSSLGANPDDVNLGLIQLEGNPSTAEIASIRDRLMEVLPGDVDVLTRDEVLRAEVSHWVDDTSYGTIFQLGVAVAMLVGTAIVYQVLAADVAALLPEYATLKAIGYRNSFLGGVVLREAVALAFLGFVPGQGISWLLYGATAAWANVPLDMTWNNVALVLVLALSMCLASGLGALRKLFNADPAELF